MNKKKNIPLCNLKRSPGRTAALMLLSALLSFSVLAGSMAISGLKSGLSSLEARLGADIMVVPYEATTKSSFENIVLQGSTGYFYMDAGIEDKIAAMEGVGQISEQIFLASATASCCSVAVQIIGFNPETDFTVSPWIKGRYDNTLGDMEIVVGNDLSLFPGDTLTFYGSTCTVKAKMNKTGTYLDSSVYASEDTIRKIVTTAMEKKTYDFGDIDPEKIVSCILVDAEDGYSPELLANDINLHVRGVSAIQTQNLVSDVSSGISGASRIIGGLIAVIWVLALFILALSFTMISNERRKEFAIYRVLGASRKKLAGILFGEAVIVSLVGSVIGSACAAAGLSLFGEVLEQNLGLPFLLPGAGGIAVLFVISAIVSAATCSLSAAYSAVRISRIDTALILRRGE